MARKPRIHYPSAVYHVIIRGKARPMTKARAIAAAIVQTAPHHRLTDLTELLGRDISALGKAAQRIAGDVDKRRLVSELADVMRTNGWKCTKLLVPEAFLLSG